MPAVTVEDILVLPRVPEPDAAAAAERPVLSVTTAPSGFEGEGFPVRRAFAGVDLRQLDPFIHMDQMGEVDYAPGEPKGTAWHPHRGFETVTYIIDGVFRHQDSNGGGGLITNGDTQWMTAGGGILHIEEPPEELVLSGGLFHGFQLWVNLPRQLKMTNPRYQDIRAQQVSLLSSPDGGALIRVIAGDLAGHPGPGVTHTPITLLHATVQPGAQLHRAGLRAGRLRHRWPGAPPGAHRPADRVRRGRRPDRAGGPGPGRPRPGAGHPGARRSADPRAGRRVRPVRDEHQG
jgi:quercetin 2,3-dioxygenase